MQDSLMCCVLQISEKKKRIQDHFERKHHLYEIKRLAQVKKKIKQNKGIPFEIDRK